MNQFFSIGIVILFNSWKTAYASAQPAFVPIPYKIPGLLGELSHHAMETIMQRIRMERISPVLSITNIFNSIRRNLLPPGVTGEFRKKMEEWPEFTILQDNSIFNFKL